MVNRPFISLPARGPVLAVLTLTLAAAIGPGGTLPADEAQTAVAKRAPAGQMCPEGSYVIGFDAAANIVCSPVRGNGVAETGQPTAPTAVAPTAAAAPAPASAPVSAPAAAPVSAPGAAPASAPAAAPAVVELSVEDTEPSSVVWGTREVTLTVTGAGFAPGSVVLFGGKTYEPAVDPSGSRLTVTLPTRSLPLGNYALTVSDGAGQQATLKKALVVY